MIDGGPSSLRRGQGRRDGGAGVNDHAKVNRGVDHVQGVEHVTSC